MIRPTRTFSLLFLLCVALSPSGVMADAGRASSAHSVVSSMNGTLVLTGSMASTATITMTGALSVGQATDLHWDLPLVTSIRQNGYSQHVADARFAFSLHPDTVRTIHAGIYPVREFTWDHPRSNMVIRVKETLRLVVHARLTPFHSDALYPLRSVSDHTVRYLRVTPLVELPAAAKALARRLAGGKRAERAVVGAVIDWVAANTRYDPTRADGPLAASWVFAHHQAACRGYADLSVALLRTLGIPARVEFGWVSAVPLRLPGPGRNIASLQWGVPGTQGEPHVWLSVWFPDAGWVPFDPQYEKFFVDTRHFAFLPNVDAGMPGNIGLIRIGPGSTLGPALAGGSPEIIPGDGLGSQVTISTRDSAHLSFRTLRHDITQGLLFAR